jgi:tetratricopeptide (TPR) repeat protein
LRDVPEAAADEEARFAAQVESLYHFAALRGIEGLLALDDLYELVLSQYLPARCRALLDAVDDLPLEDPQSRALAALMRARLARSTSDYEPMLAEIAAAEQLIEGHDGHLALRILRESSTDHRLAGHPADALEGLERYDRSATVGESPFLRGLSERNRALILKDTDRIAEARDACERARFLLSTIGPDDDTNVRGMGITDVASLRGSVVRAKGRLSYLVGDYVDAVEQFESFLDSFFDTQAGEYARVTLGHVLRQEDQLDSAENLARDAVDRFITDRETRGISTAMILLAEVLAAKEQDAEARAVFQRLIDEGPGINPFGPLYGELGLAELDRLYGATGSAHDRYVRVIDGSTRLDTRLEAAFAHLGLSLLRSPTAPRAGLADAEAALAIGVQCQTPWVQVYAYLAAALTGAPDAADRVAAASSCLTHFSRRPIDADLDSKIVASVGRWLEDGGEAPRLRLRLL